MLDDEGAFDDDRGAEFDCEATDRKDSSEDLEDSGTTREGCKSVMVDSLP